MKIFITKQGKLKVITFHPKHWSKFYKILNWILLPQKIGNRSLLRMFFNLEICFLPYEFIENQRWWIKKDIRNLIFEF